MKPTLQAPAAPPSFRAKRGIPLATLVVLLAAACTKSVAVTLNLVSATCTGTDALAADGGVQFLKFTITVDGGLFGTPEIASVASQTLDLPATPLGTLDIEVDGLSDSTASAQILAQGNSGPFSIPSDGSVSSESVTIFLRGVDRAGYTNGSGTPTKCTTMTQPRAYHSQVLLPDGKVLIYGGVDFGASASEDDTVDWSRVFAIPPQVASDNEIYYSTAEIYDPTTGQFTQAGSWAPDGGTLTARANAKMLAFTNGAAMVIGGEDDSPSPASVGNPLTPGANGGLFSPSETPPWQATKTASAHGRGCLAVDTGGEALMFGGYVGSNQTTPQGEFFDPTAWPPVPHVVDSFDGGTPQNRADLACSGFEGVDGLFQGLLLEVGGTMLDSSGNGYMLSDFFVEHFVSATAQTPANFEPYVGPQGLLANSLQYPRSHAKAAPMIVTEAADGGATFTADAMLVTGGFTCDPPEPGVLECTPAFAGGQSSGQLANPPSAYFVNDAGIDVGQTTDLIYFPGNTVVPSKLGANMSVERIDHCAVPLPDGRVILIGGLSGTTSSTFGSTASVEIAADDPAGAPSKNDLPLVTIKPATGSLLTPRAGMACTLLQDGSILVTGGVQTTGALSGTTQPVKTLQTAEIYRPLPLQH